MAKQECCVTAVLVGTVRVAFSPARHDVIRPAPSEQFVNSLPKIGMGNVICLQWMPEPSLGPPLVAVPLHAFVYIRTVGDVQQGAAVVLYASQQGEEFCPVVRLAAGAAVGNITRVVLPASVSWMKMS